MWQLVNNLPLSTQDVEGVINCPVEEEVEVSKPYKQMENNLMENNLMESNQTVTNMETINNTIERIRSNQERLNVVNVEINNAKSELGVRISELDALDAHLIEQVEHAEAELSSLYTLINTLNDFAPVLEEEEDVCNRGEVEEEIVPPGLAPQLQDINDVFVDNIDSTTFEGECLSSTKFKKVKKKLIAEMENDEPHNVVNRYFYEYRGSLSNSQKEELLKLVREKIKSNEEHFSERSEEHSSERSESAKNKKATPIGEQLEQLKERHSSRLKERHSSKRSEVKWEHSEEQSAVLITEKGATPIEVIEEEEDSLPRVPSPDAAHSSAKREAQEYATLGEADSFVAEEALITEEELPF